MPNISTLKKEIVINKMNTIMLHLKNSLKRKKALEKAIKSAREQIKLAEKELEETTSYIEEIQDKYGDFATKALNLGWNESYLSQYEEMMKDHLAKLTRAKELDEEEDEDVKSKKENKLDKYKKSSSESDENYCEDKELQAKKEMSHYEDEEDEDEESSEYRKNENKYPKKLKSYGSKPISKAGRKCKNKSLDDLTLGDFDLNNVRDRKLFDDIMKKELNS